LSATPDNVIPLAALTHSDDQPLVAPGTYAAIYVGHYCAVVFKNAATKVCLRMRLVEHADVVLERWYRVSDYAGGRIKANRSSDIVRELRDVLGRAVRHDRIPITALRGIYVFVDVRTVTVDRDQREITENNRYSVISRLIRKMDP
jgi:hypothetical protein